MEGFDGSVRRNFRGEFSRGFQDIFDGRSEWRFRDICGDIFGGNFRWRVSMDIFDGGFRWKFSRTFFDERCDGSFRWEFQWKWSMELSGKVPGKLQRSFKDVFRRQVSMAFFDPYFVVSFLEHFRERQLSFRSTSHRSGGRDGREGRGREGKGGEGREREGTEGKREGKAGGKGKEARGKEG